MTRKWIFIIPAAIVGIVAFTFIGGEAVKLLWNWLMPAIFGLRPIVFWQALGLLALCRILFGGHGFRGGGSGMKRRLSDRMADRVGAGWMRMTPEEREQFRERIRARCGFDSASSNTTKPEGM